MKKIKWGIISTGNIARSICADFVHVSNGEIHAVASRSLDTAASFAKHFGIERYYDSYEALYRDPEIDAIYIGTPHNFHRENATAAMMAGKAVLCEKPITTNENELRQLIETAKNTNTYLMEAMWTYFLPAIIQAKSWLDSGEIGELKHIRADFAFLADPQTNLRLFDPKLAGGALLDIGIYPIALSCLAMPQLPISICASSKKASTGVDSEESMVFEYLNGTTANLMASFLFDMPNDAYFIGTKGYISIPEFFMAKECFLYKNKQIAGHFVDDKPTVGYSYELEAVNNDLLAGKKQSEIMPWSVSIMLQKIMDIVKQKF
ncbi:MAG: Gfo/Idh/MocA family oxidoreductase [Cyclobacteriaceae bacterium]|nr:Gfo/Idh/MocA family oxidoreductase [Cyclobacteriaceae bacterium]